MYPGVHAKTQPDKVAALRPATGERLTYGELNDRSNRLAQHFHAHGLRSGDHVAAFMENQLAFFEVVWACMRSGLYLTPLNRHLTASEALPRLPTGKLYKKALRDQYWAAPPQSQA